MKRLPLLLGLLLAPLLPATRAAVAELAPDLAYVRVHSPARQLAELADALGADRALVLDLRYPLDERGAGETLRHLLAGRTAPARLYVLVSPATPVPVVGAIASHPTALLTLGVPGSRPEPRIPVRQSAEDDRRAFDALTAGTPLAGLISGKIGKERYDEASLVEEFRHGLAPTLPVPTLSPPPAPPPPDRVLQRALHLHRALQALHR